MAGFNPRLDWQDDEDGGTPVYAADVLRWERGISDGHAAAGTAADAAGVAKTAAGTAQSAADAAAARAQVAALGLGSLLLTPPKSAAAAGIDTAAIRRVVEQMIGRPTDVFAAALTPPPLQDIPVVGISYAAPAGSTLVKPTRIGSASGPADMAGDPAFLYDGAPAFPGQTNNPDLFVKPGLIPGGAAQAAYYVQRISFITADPTPVYKVRLSSTSTGFRIRVGRRWVSEELTRLTGLNAGGWAYITLAFPSSREREITIEDSGSLAFGGVHIAPGYTVKRPPPLDLKVGSQGDSFTAGAAAPPDGATRLETWVNYFVRALEEFTGLRIGHVSFAIGGTGYVTAGGLFSVREDAIKAYAPDLLVIQGSRNDGNATTIEAAVASHLAAFAAIPAILVTGPSTTPYEPNRDQVRSATLAAGRTFVDGLDRYITTADLGTDKVHPTFVAHKKIARGLFLDYSPLFKLRTLAASGGGTGPTGPAVLFTDTFARSVSGVGGSFGVTDDGKAWNRFGQGDVVIDAAGAGYSAAPGFGMQIVNAASDGIYRVVLAAVKDRLTIVARQSADYRLVVEMVGGVYQFTRRPTDATKAGSFPTTVKPAAGDVIDLVLNGESVSLIVNGALILTNRDPNNIIGVGAGVGTFIGHTDVRWRSVKFTALA